MKSDFERKRFIQRFVILAVILLAVVGIGIRFLFGGDEKRIAVILLMLAVGLVILFSSVIGRSAILIGRLSMCRMRCFA